MEELAAQISAGEVTPSDVSSWRSFVERTERLWRRSFGPLDEVSSYALERLLAAHRLWDPSSSSPVSALASDLDRYRTASPSDRVRIALEAEYGRVLPSLDRSVFVLRWVSSRLLSLPSSEHAATARSLFSTYHPGRPVALVAPSRGRLKVIDGYHRSSAALDAGVRELLVVYAQD